ncbi:RpiB/LacA/LacB family sugar-phosphate isomerase [Treponema sp. Marseille-Q4130]|uniref:RpiB/LacA/LacB family sugar-phosphate isomerase n=1 Tax=Treponema TaxID=157 RepID=UPI00165299C0|nr:RpiB/LacA/LacB family sugar-phosphate isomerase [Treponema sp. Marseille-Q4130]MBC6721090.1 RpiB/LacA/LacB family sugar-phosphate isomerase [Treponema sp. Marseille-Q4130]
MKIGFGSDHSGVALKRILMEHVRGKGYECVDYGAADSNIPANYAEFGLKIGEAIASREVEKGVMVCGSGVGISLAANKVPGVRAAVCSEPCTAKLAVEHSDINAVAMGVCIVGQEEAKMIVDAFLDAEFEGGVYTERVDTLSAIERKYGK